MCTNRQTRKKKKKESSRGNSLERLDSVREDFRVGKHPPTPFDWEIFRCFGGWKILQESWFQPLCVLTGSEKCIRMKDCHPFFRLDRSCMKWRCLWTMEGYFSSKWKNRFFKFSVNWCDWCSIVYLNKVEILS